jgi:hypothetical protein
MRFHNSELSARFSRAALFSALLTAYTLYTGEASAIINGVSTNLDRHMVRVHGGRGIQCSGVAIDRNAVITAAHCGAGSVSAGGQYIGVVSHARGTVKLDNGQSVTVVGDSVVVKLRSPLPASVVPLPVGSPDDSAPFVIAGYGTPSESTRAIGTLREATLIDSKVERHMLVDPNRSGAISASACFGDSGGPVLQRSAGGYVVVGVITRANYPNKPIACGFYTRYAPLTPGGTAVAAQSVAPTPAAVAATPVAITTPNTAPQPQRRVMAQQQQGERPVLFARWSNYFAEQAKAREAGIKRFRAQAAN